MTFNTTIPSDMNKNEQPIIVGLDIGTTKVVAIAGRKNEFGKLEILGLGMADSAGVDHGVVLNIEECRTSINKALANCLNSNPDLEINEVYVGIAGKHIKSIQTRGERIRANTEEEIIKEDIDLLINDQRKIFIPAGDQIIDIIPQDYVIDSTPRVGNPIGMNGVKIGANFHIITGDRNAIRNIKRCVDKTGLITKDLVLQPLASAAAIMSSEDLEAGVAVIDIGGGTTDLAVFYDGILKHTAVIPFAGTNITEDIRQGLGVLRTQAEAMKTQFGTALAQEANSNAYITIPGLRGLPPRQIAVKNLASIIEARMREILEYAMAQLKALNLDQRLFGGIILTGGGSELKNILQLTEFVTGLSARIGYPVEHISATEIDNLNNPRYSTCIGLILRGYADFESGKSLESDTQANIITSEKELENMEEIQTAQTPIVEEPILEEDQLIEEEVIKKRKESKSGETVKKILSSVKFGFLSIFEDVKDDKI